MYNNYDPVSFRGDDICMKKLVFKVIVLAAMLLGLPLLGVFLAGRPISVYLEFPPKTSHVAHVPFSWPVFFLFFILILIFVLPLLFRMISVARKKRPRKTAVNRFPWWGWLGVMTGAGFWILAWNRFAWFAPFQPHTFFPLWLSYILVINGLGYRRTGRCLMLNRTGYFLLLFPASAAFWWFFEYLNRFVGNWNYSGAQYDPWEYFWLATLSFSTVLPAVLGTRDWISGSPLIREAFENTRPISISRPVVPATAGLILSGSGLAGIGIWPDLLFPLLWVSPLIIIICLQVLLGEPTVLSGISRGNWHIAAASALAALFCGWFWEMWNIFSLAKWEYAIPFVYRFKIFEMPVLGYAGYLPFGLECTVVGAMLVPIKKIKFM